MRRIVDMTGTPLPDRNLTLEIVPPHCDDPARGAEAGHHQELEVHVKMDFY